MGRRKTSRRGRGKGKGAAYERRVCRQLSLWWSGLDSQDLFWRSAMSGGRATVHRAKGIELTASAGDISAIDKRGSSLLALFTVELKHLKKWELHLAIYRGTGQFANAWEQACEQVAPGRQPMLIGKENNQADLLCLTTLGVQRLAEAWERKNRTRGWDARRKARKIIRERAYFTIPWLDANVFMFSDLLTEIQPGAVRASNKQLIRDIYRQDGTQ